MTNKKYKLGKKEPVNKLSVAFGDFITTYPTTPLVDFAPDYIYPMDLNDQYGDCVVAGFDHSRQIITGLLTGQQKNFTTIEIENFYKTQNPNFPIQDEGMSIQLFLEYLVTNKYILGFAKIDHNNDAQMKAAMYLGLSIMTGVQLQQAQETQFATGTWDFVRNSPIVGGHCINGAGYNVGIYDIVSWGKLIAATYNFITNQLDEAWFILMQEHVDHPGFRNSFDLVGFSKAVNVITGGKVVIPIPSIPTPTPTPIPPTPNPWPYKYFTPTESTGGGHTVSQLKPQLIQALDTMRGLAGVSFSITSGFRTVAENAAVGGVPNSAHLVGLAADIAVTNSTRQKIMKGILSSNIPCFTEDAVAHIHVDLYAAIHPLGDGIVSQNG